MKRCVMLVAVKTQTQAQSWNQRASDDDSMFCCTVYAHLLVADQVADEQRHVRVGIFVNGAILRRSK
jgi:hypothetical protein